MTRLKSSAAWAVSAGVLVAAGTPGVSGAASAPDPGGPTAALDQGITGTPANSQGAFAAAPADFDPLQANNDDLQRYGYPTRPPGTTPDWWLDFVQSKNRVYDPGTEMPGVSVGPPPGVSGGGGQTGRSTPTNSPTLPSDLTLPPGVSEADAANPKLRATSNWMGFETVKGSYPIVQVQLYWAIPAVSQYPGDSGLSDLSVWPGIGTGSQSDPLIQAGSGSDVNGSLKSYYCWTEMYPFEYEHLMSMGCHPGDVIHVLIQVYAAIPGQGQHAYFEIKNETTGADQFRPYFFTGSYGSQVEWIGERNSGPGGHGSYNHRNLPQFAGFAVHGATANDSGLNSKNLSHGYTYKDYMTTDAGTPIGRTGDPSSTNAFSMFRMANSSWP